MKEINSFQDFVKELREAGFTIGGEKGDGVFTLSDSFGEKIVWHTEDRIRIPGNGECGYWMNTGILPMESCFFIKADILQKNGILISWRCGVEKRSCRKNMRKAM
ncbi:MAG: hypothetical protein ACLR0F_09640 [Eisenbergiella sp.]